MANDAPNSAPATNPRTTVPLTAFRPAQGPGRRLVGPVSLYGNMSPALYYTDPYYTGPARSYPGPGPDKWVGARVPKLSGA
jgi:hypothetical protein